MGKIKLLFTVVLGFLFGYHGHSQEQLGIKMDNYTGLEQAMLNPSFAATSPLKFDIHFVGFSLYAENNYAYIHHTSILDMALNEHTFSSAFDLDGTPAPKGSLVADLYDTPNDKFVKFNSTLTGPSIMLKIGGQHSIGVFTNMRSAFSATDIPAVLNYYSLDKRGYNESFSIDPFTAAGSIWNETGIHYGFNIEKSNGYIAFGANLKYNSFLESGFFGLQDKMEFNKVSKDSIILGHPAVEFAITNGNLSQFSVDAAHKDFTVKNPSVNFYGHTVSFDIGASIQIEGDGVDGYRWRAGASVVDFGLAKLDQKSEFHTSYPIPTEMIIDLDDLNGASTVNELEQKISTIALGDPKASLKEKNFKMGLPTAISLQGDYQVIQNVFVGGVMIQPIKLARYNLTRTAVLAVAPRFENRFFSFSAPIVLRDWKSVKMGLSGRVGFLTLGTDNLGSFLHKTDFTGTDFYLSLRLNAVNLPGFLSGGHKRNRNSKLGCYGF